jgi:hypothetical protein
VILDEFTKAEAFPSQQGSQPVGAHRDRISSGDPESLELAAKIARWTTSNMQGKDGHSYYRDLGWEKLKTPMLHWGQGTMFRALAHLPSKLNGQANTWADN